MKNKSLILLICAFIYAASGSAQTQQLSGFKTINSRSISPIFDGKEVKGYALIYKSDKADKENDNIHIAVYDVNLALSKTIDLKKPRGKYLMLGNAYNGEGIGFYFYNFKDKQFEIEMFDKNLVKKAEVTDNHKLTNMEQMAINNAKAADDKEQSTFGVSMNIFPVLGEGFITNGSMKNGKGYSLKMYDNMLKEKWTYATPEDADYYEAIMISEVTGKYLIGNVIRRPSLMSSKMTFYLTVFDALTGKKKMEVPISGAGGDQLSLNTIVYDEPTDQIIAIGDYYAEGDKVGSARSKGFYFKVYTPDGKEVQKQMYSWEKDVKSKMPPEANESLSKNAMNYTHKILKGDDGKFYLVTEQYAKSASGAGIATMAMGGSANVTKAVIWNLMVIVLNKDLTLNEIKYYTKDRSDAELPPGMDFYGPGMWGMVMKQMGSFDYQFTQLANDGKSADIVYINYDKEKGEDTKRVLGNVIISPDGKFTLDKMDITTKASSSFLYPAKPGFLMMVDYLKKERSLGMKLVKLNY
jgi:hypothetical protein